MEYLNVRSEWHGWSAVLRVVTLRVPYVLQWEYCRKEGKGYGRKEGKDTVGDGKVVVGVQRLER